MPLKNIIKKRKGFHQLNLNGVFSEMTKNVKIEVKGGKSEKLLNENLGGVFQKCGKQLHANIQKTKQNQESKSILIGILDELFSGNIDFL